MPDESTVENKINNLLTLGMEPFSTLRTQRVEWNGTWMERLEKERTRMERNMDGTVGKITNENGTI